MKKYSKKYSKKNILKKKHLQKKTKKIFGGGKKNTVPNYNSTQENDLNFFNMNSVQENNFQSEILNYAKKFRIIHPNIPYINLDNIKVPMVLNESFIKTFEELVENINNINYIFSKEFLSLIDRIFIKPENKKTVNIFYEQIKNTIIQNITKFFDKKIDDALT